MVANLLCAQTLLGLAVFGTFFIGMLNLAPSGGPAAETEQLELSRFVAPFFLAGLALYSLVIVSGLGYLLARVERRGLCVALSIAALLYMPMGTLLGVFALLVLNRSDTRALFEGAEDHGRPAVL
jgi:NO-binding membrane sensor protein with MHYT domain